MHHSDWEISHLFAEKWKNQHGLLFLQNLFLLLNKAGINSKNVEYIAKGIKDAVDSYAKI